MGLLVAFVIGAAAPAVAQEDPVIAAEQRMMADAPAEDPYASAPEEEAEPLSSSERVGRAIDRVILEVLLGDVVGVGGFLLGVLSCAIEDGEADLDWCLWAGGSIGFSLGVTAGIGLAGLALGHSGNVLITWAGAAVGTLLALGVTFMVPETPAAAWTAWLTLPVAFGVVGYELTVGDEPVPE